MATLSEFICVFKKKSGKEVVYFVCSNGSSLISFSSKGLVCHIGGGQKSSGKAQFLLFILFLQYWIKVSKTVTALSIV